VRRPAPRPLGAALAGVTKERAPATVLARVQSLWAEVAGPAVGAEAEPVAEREGTVTVECRSAVWAQELELLARDLLPRLNERLGPAARVRGLRFVTGSRAGASGAKDLD
jgi:predicted nucleic acid-binding Zn ribbon protein